LTLPDIFTDQANYQGILTVLDRAIYLTEQAQIFTGQISKMLDLVSSFEPTQDLIDLLNVMKQQLEFWQSIQSLVEEFFQEFQEKFSESDLYPNFKTLVDDWLIEANQNQTEITNLISQIDELVQEISENLSALSDMPTLPSVPTTPSLPTLPSIPTLPGIPTTPGIPDFTAPSNTTADPTESQDNEEIPTTAGKSNSIGSTTESQEQPNSSDSSGSKSTVTTTAEISETSEAVPDTSEVPHDISDSGANNLNFDPEQHSIMINCNANKKGIIGELQISNIVPTLLNYSANLNVSGLQLLPRLLAIPSMPDIDQNLQNVLLQNSLQQGLTVSEQLEQRISELDESINQYDQPITADFAGLIAELNVEQGQTIDQATTALKIFSDNELVAIYQANKRDAMIIEVGQKVIYDYEDLELTGEVIYKSPVAKSQSETFSDGLEDMNLQMFGNMSGSDSILRNSNTVLIKMNISGDDLDKVIIGFDIDSG